MFFFFIFFQCILVFKLSLLKGNILRSEIDGCIQMRTFVAGYPEVKIALSEDFFVGKSDVVSRGKLSSSSLKGKIYINLTAFKVCYFVIYFKTRKITFNDCHWLRADQFIFGSAVRMFIIFSVNHK